MFKAKVPFQPYFYVRTTVGVERGYAAAGILSGSCEQALAFLNPPSTCFRQVSGDPR